MRYDTEGLLSFLVCDTFIQWVLSEVLQQLTFLFFRWCNVQNESLVFYYRSDNSNVVNRQVFFDYQLMSVVNTPKILFLVLLFLCQITDERTVFTVGRCLYEGLLRSVDNCSINYFSFWCIYLILSCFRYFTCLKMSLCIWVIGFLLYCLSNRTVLLLLIFLFLSKALNFQR